MSPIVRPLLTRAGAALGLGPFGFGSAPLGNMHRGLSEEEARLTLDAAWDSGLRYFDTAPLYGHGLAELRVGTFLGQKPRDSFVLSTKVGRLLSACAPGASNSGIYVETPDFKVEFDYSYDGVMRSFDDSLRRLGLDRVDILYVHDIDARTHGSRQAAEARRRELMNGGGWRALDELRASGAVRAIGAGVNENEPCEQLLEDADPDIFLLAGRYTLLDQSALRRLLPACLRRGVGVVIGGPFNSGILATGAVPGAWYDYSPAPKEIMERTEAIRRVCATNGVELAHAALHFPLTHPAVCAVVPGSQNVREVERNTVAMTSPPQAALWSELASKGLLPAEAVESSAG